MTRTLVIPAAGRGSRLGFDGPKALCPANGRPLIAHILDRYRGHAQMAVVVVAPDAVRIFEAALRDAALPVTLAVQPAPTGMLPAVLAASPAVATQGADEVWITWCDQVGTSTETIRALGTALAAEPKPAFAFPTVRQEPPYIHFDRDREGAIVAVRQQRDGDLMPPVGESDAGLFAMPRATFERALRSFGDVARPSGATGEINFLPFIPWLARTALVRTVPIADSREAVGVNTPADLALVEAFLRDSP